MTFDPPRIVLLEDVSEPVDASSAMDEKGLEPPVRTLQDRRGNRFVLLSVAHYLRLLSEASEIRTPNASSR